MTFWLNVTNQARDDITRNAAWWAENYSLDEALKWYDSVYEQLNKLLANPEGHGIAAENDSFPYDLRKSLLKERSGLTEPFSRLSERNFGC